MVAQGPPKSSTTAASLCTLSKQWPQREYGLFGEEEKSLDIIMAEGRSQVVFSKHKLSVEVVLKQSDAILRKPHAFERDGLVIF